MKIKNDKKLFYVVQDESRKDIFNIYLTEDMIIKPGEINTVYTGLSIIEMSDIDMCLVLDKPVDYDNVFVSISTSVFDKTRESEEIRFDIVNYGKQQITLKKDTYISRIQECYMKNSFIKEDEVLAYYVYKDNEVVAKSFKEIKQYEIVHTPEGEVYLKIGLNNGKATTI